MTYSVTNAACRLSCSLVMLSDTNLLKLLCLLRHLSGSRGSSVGQLVALLGVVLSLALEGLGHLCALVVRGPGQACCGRLLCWATLAQAKQAHLMLQGTDLSRWVALKVFRLQSTVESGW